MARFLFLARFLGKVSWYAARQPVRARSCDMTVGYADPTMDKTASKIKYTPGKTNSGLRNITGRN